LCLCGFSWVFHGFSDESRDGSACPLFPVAFPFFSYTYLYVATMKRSTTDQNYTKASGAPEIVTSILQTTLVQGENGKHKPNIRSRAGSNCMVAWWFNPRLLNKEVLN